MRKSICGLCDCFHHDSKCDAQIIVTSYNCSKCEHSCHLMTCKQMISYYFKTV